MDIYNKTGLDQKHPCNKITSCRCCYHYSIVVVEGVHVVVVIPVYVRVAVVIYRKVALVAFLAQCITQCLL